MKFAASLILLLTGVSALVAFSQITPSIAADGFLKEPFALIPIGYGLCFLGGIGLVVLSGREIANRAIRS